jgi:hypothetical protein
MYHCVRMSQNRIVSVCYQVIMSHNDDDNLIFGYALVHHLSPHWARHMHHVSTLVLKQHLQLVFFKTNIVRKWLKASALLVVTLHKLSFGW